MFNRVYKLYAPGLAYQQGIMTRRNMWPLKALRGVAFNLQQIMSEVPPQKSGSVPMVPPLARPEVILYRRLQDGNFP